MQLSVDVQIPQRFGGNDGHAVYIDSEGSFVVERLVDIAQAAVRHCQFIASVQRNEGEKQSRLEQVLCINPICTGRSNKIYTPKSTLIFQLCFKQKQN